MFVQLCKYSLSRSIHPFVSDRWNVFICTIMITFAICCVQNCRVLCCILSDIKLVIIHRSDLLQAVCRKHLCSTTRTKARHLVRKSERRASRASVECREKHKHSNMHECALLPYLSSRRWRTLCTRARKAHASITAQRAHQASTPSRRGPRQESLLETLRAHELTREEYARSNTTVI